MEVNISPWCYYKKDFVDPLYSPYLFRGNNGIVYPSNIEQRQTCGYAKGSSTATPNSEGMGYKGRATVDTPPAVLGCGQISGEGCQSLWVQPERVRKNWHQSFQRMHRTRPCPVGWTAVDHDPNNPLGGDVSLGWCVKAEPESNGVFYTKDMYERFHLGQTEMEKRLPPFTKVQYNSGPEKRGFNPNQSKFWDDGNNNFRRTTNVYSQPRSVERYLTSKAKDSYLA